MTDTGRALLLARRIPHAEIMLGRAYVIHARNGGIGVAVPMDDGIGYKLHREKYGHHYLFTEIDWADSPVHGTAIPLALIDAAPPTDAAELLAWLAEQEHVHRDAIREAWNIVLGVDHD